jgi:hypothetical protein
MATLTDQAAGTHVTSVPSNFEPDDQWKADLRKKIEVNLTSMVEKARQVYEDKLKDHSFDPSAVTNEYKTAISDIRVIAEEHYRHAIERERQERMWASGHQVDQGWSEAMIKEQQAILDNIQREVQPPSRKNTSDDAIRSEEPNSVPTRATQREDSTIVNQGVQERTSSAVEAGTIQINIQS